MKGRKVTVEVSAGEAHGDDRSQGGKRRARAGKPAGGRKEKGRDGKADMAESRKDGKAGGKQERGKNRKPAKPSREERGYTSPRGKKYTQDDWKQFFEPKGSGELKGDEPDFSEEGWARRYPKK